MTLRTGSFGPYIDNFISPVSPSAIGFAMFGYNGGGLAASTAWPTAAKAFYIPFTIERQLTLYRVGWHNGATTVSGTREVGLYSAGGTKIISGSATGATVSVMQFVDVADTVVNPGQYWLAVMCSNTTNWHAWAPAAPITAAMGILSQASASPLPSSATMALDQTNAFVPLAGLQCRSVA